MQCNLPVGKLEHRHPLVARARQRATRVQSSLGLCIAPRCWTRHSAKHTRCTPDVRLVIARHPRQDRSQRIRGKIREFCHAWAPPHRRLSCQERRGNAHDKKQKKYLEARPAVSERCGCSRSKPSRTRQSLRDSRSPSVSAFCTRTRSQGEKHGCVSAYLPRNPAPQVPKLRPDNPNTRPESTFSGPSRY